MKSFALLLPTILASEFTDWWVDRWCDMGGIFNFADFACTYPEQWTTMISSVQRTKTGGINGFALKTKVDASDTMLEVQMQLTTPMLSSGNAVEMSFSMPMDEGATSYDTALCLIPWYSVDSMQSNTYEVYDLIASAPLSELPKVADLNASNAYFATNLGDGQ